MSTTTIVRMRETGAPEVLALETVPLPLPAEGEARIAVRAAGVNYHDVLVRAGRLPARVLPFTPGIDVAGVIDAVGLGVDLAVGTRVLATLFGRAGGGYAEHVVVSAREITPLPEIVGFEEAVALPVNGVTALLALRIAGRIAPGDTVFVPSAAGGVGSFAVQLARRLGARRVIGAASSEAKRRFVLELGADEAVDVAPPPESLRADVILSNGGGPLDASIRALAPGGRIVVFGAEDVLRPPSLDATTMLALLRHGQAIVGFALMSQPESVRRAALGELLALAPVLRIPTERFALAHAAEAHRAFEARTTRGKVVLVTAPAEEAPRAALGRFLAALEAFSVDALADSFSEEGIMEFPFLEPARPTCYEGREAIRAGFRGVWKPGLVAVEAVRVSMQDARDPEVVICEGELDARVLANGRRFQSRFVLIARVRGGAIVHLRDYTDAVRVARGLGRLGELAAAFS